MSNLDWALAALDNPKPRKPVPVVAVELAADDAFHNRQAPKDPAAMLASALELVRAAGYRVTKAKAPRATQRPALNCLGLPMSPNYDPAWKRKTPLTSIARLYAPNSFPWVQ